VRVRAWTGKTPTHELLGGNGNKCTVQQRVRELVPLFDSVRELSTVTNSVDKVNFERLFPGSLVFDNALGGKIFTFAGSPKVAFNIQEAFSFLNFSRKQQLIRILDVAGELPLYYPGDEEVYFRAADMEDGGMFCAVFNLSCDPIEQPVLISKKKLSSVERLCPDGTLESVKFEEGEFGAYTMDLVCEHLYPVILILH